MRYPQLGSRAPGGDHPLAPLDRKAVESHRQFHLLPPEPDAVGFGRRDALRLPLADILPLRLRQAV